MNIVTQSQVDDWDGLIQTLARQRCRMAGIEYSDLCQEGRLSVITSYAMGSVPTEKSIINSLRRYMRAVKGGRAVQYEPTIQSMESLPS